MLHARMTDLTRFAAERFGDATALVLPTEQVSFSFREINARVAHFAGGLRGLGVRPGDRVVLHLPNGWQWIVAYHAIARAGGVVVPANILLSSEETGFLARDSGAHVLILPADRVSGFTRSSLILVALGKAEGSVPFDSLCEAAAVAPVERAPDDLFTIGYTSGTTGRPKGATLTHGNLFASLSGTATAHVRHEGDTVLSSLPFPHVYGNIVMNCAFLAGTKLVTTPRFEAGEVLRLISQQRATLFEGVPTMYYQLLAHPDCEAADLSSLTRCTVGGQTMPTAKIEAVVERFGCPLLELWGMTEVGGPATTHSPYWAPRPGSIGMPFPGTEARIAQIDDPSSDAPIGVPGELMVRGAQVTAGYWNNAGVTAEAIDADGWLATGDIGRRDEDGYYYIVDRKKDLIITAGYNVYPAELEQVVAMHPAVAMVAVAAVNDAEKGELAYAFVVRHADASVDEAEIVAHCRQHLAAYKVPRRVLFVDDLPKTSTGKILRRILAETFVPPAQITA